MPDGLQDAYHYRSFQDKAKIQWDSVLNSTFAHCQHQDIIWEVLRVEFNGKYFPLDVRKRKEHEFQTLLLCPMIVVQYETRFKALDRFALDLVPTKERGIEKFYNDLHHEIRIAYLERKFTIFGDVMRVACEVKRVKATRPH